MLRLALIGPPVVTVDDVAVTFDTRKAIALLAVLAAEGRAQPRDRLAGLLWPDADAIRARSALRRTLSVTAAAVGPALAVDRSAVALDTTHATSDVAEFRAWVSDPDPATVRRALDLYRDDFLAGFALRDAADFDDWQAQVGEELRRLLASGLSTLVDHESRSGEFDSAIGHAQRWLALDPLHEPAHHALIRLYAWTGQRSAAMRQYRTCVRVLDTELGVQPLEETTRLYDAVRRDDLPPPDNAPPPRAPAAGAVGRSRAVVIGRDAELSVLRQALAHPAAGPGVVALVVGVTGVGKTTLLREAERGGAAGLSISVRCHPEESALAYGVAIELVRGVVARAPDALARMPRHVRAELARLLPEIAELDGAAAGDDPAAAARLYAAVRELLASLGARVVFVIDDAHWADAASADLLAFLLRRLSTTPLTCVIAWASDASTGPSTVLRAAHEAVEAGDGVEMRLRPLDVADVAALVEEDPAVAGVDVDRLVQDTGGLPALVTAYLDSVRRGEDPVAGTASAVRDSLARRLRSLSETGQQVMAAAAVLGGRVDPDVLRETSGRGDAESVAAVEEALAAGLLVEVPAGDGYDFPFEALRRVVVEETTVARRRLLHQRAASALVRRATAARMTAADAGTIARHFHEAGRLDEAAAWHWRAAGEARRLHAHEAALDDVRAALALGHAPAAARLAEGELLVALGHYREAIHALELAAAAADPVSIDAMRVERTLADVHHRLGDYVVADAHLCAALDLVTELGLGDEERAEVLVDRALVACRRGALDTAQQDVEAAHAAANRAGATRSIARASNVAGIVAGRRGDLVTAERAFGDSLVQADRAGDDHTVIAALNNHARVLTTAGRHEEALDLAQQALEQGLRLGDRHRIAALHTNLADVLRAVGRDDESMLHLKQAASTFAGVDDEPLRRPEIWTLVEW